MASSKRQQVERKRGRKHHSYARRSAIVVTSLIFVLSTLASTALAFSSQSTPLTTRSLFGRTRPHQTSLQSSKSSPSEAMFTLLVVMRFQSEEAKSVWSESLKVLGKYVREKEPNTLQYLFSESEEDPLVITIFETYTSKADFGEVHMKSEAFLAHVERTKAYEDQIKADSFITGNVIQEFGYFTK